MQRYIHRTAFTFFSRSLSEYVSTSGPLERSFPNTNCCLARMTSLSSLTKLQGRRADSWVTHDPRGRSPPPPADASFAAPRLDIAEAGRGPTTGPGGICHSIETSLSAHQRCVVADRQAGGGGGCPQTSITRWSSGERDVRLDVRFDVRLDVRFDVRLDVRFDVRLEV